MQERLQKFLARSGVASRRHAEELIVNGRVMVNNQVVTQLGTKIDPAKDLVTVDGKLVSAPAEHSYFLFYKPPGVVTTLKDPQGRVSVGDYIRRTKRRLFPVGRLDYDAEGALLLTDDGELANRLLHPRFQVPRVYLAKVKGEPTAQTLEKLRGGVRLEDGMARPVSVDVFERADRNTWLQIVVTEGRPHLVKRLCAAVGHPVVRLFRPGYAGISVEGLKPGEMRPLTPEEVAQLRKVARGEPPELRAWKLPPRRHGHLPPGLEPEEEAAATKPSARERPSRRHGRPKPPARPPPARR